MQILFRFENKSLKSTCKGSRASYVIICHLNDPHFSLFIALKRLSQWICICFLGKQNNGGSHKNHMETSNCLVNSYGFSRNPKHIFTSVWLDTKINGFCFECDNIES